jgi:hypothetical protein
VAFGSPLYFRRGPFTGLGWHPAADREFRRAERLRIDVPLARAMPIAARLLDRNGQPMVVPVASGAREEQGLLFTTAEIGLAPLAPGDYLVEIAASEGDRRERMLVAFRMTPR